MNHEHVWKRRVRTTISANPSDKEILLAICWTTQYPDDAALPRKAVKDDPILWNIWRMKTGWSYKVWIKRPGVSRIDEKEFKSEADALADYRARCKEFPRSKDVDYGYPVDDT